MKNDLRRNLSAIAMGLLLATGVEAKTTITGNRKLFAQLVDIVRSLFSVGRNNQQDLIRAQLELSRLDDRLAKITQMIESQRSKLSRWVGAGNSNRPLADKLPEIPAPGYRR